MAAKTIQVCLGAFPNENHTITVGTLYYFMLDRCVKDFSPEYIEQVVLMCVCKNTLLYRASPGAAYTKPEQLQADGLLKLSDHKDCLLVERRMILSTLQSNGTALESSLLANENYPRMEETLNMLCASGLIQQRVNHKHGEMEYQMAPPVDDSPKAQLEREIRAVITRRMYQGRHMLQKVFTHVANSKILQRAKTMAHDDSGMPLLTEEEFDGIVAKVFQDTLFVYNEALDVTRTAPAMLRKTVYTDGAMMTQKKQTPRDVENTLETLLQLLQSAAEDAYEDA